jgi:photosystem II stability/assembly factor-like uncharacterized protein
MKIFIKILLTFVVIWLLTACDSSNRDPARLAWAVGDGNTTVAAVLFSEDGGETWTRQGEDSVAMQNFSALNLYVADSKNLWVVGSNTTLIRSTDGGSQWEKITTIPGGTDAINFYDISGIGESELWISSDNGVVLHTTDAAQTWEVFYLTPAFMVQGIKAISSDLIYAVGSNPDDSGAVMRTLNGGKTWEHVTDIEEGIYEYVIKKGWIGVTSTDTDHIVVYGGRGRFAYTADSGETWLTGDVGENDINHLVMLNNTTWWAALDFNHIALATENGALWNDQNTTGVGPSGQFFVGIDAINEEHAIVVGEAQNPPFVGSLLLTRDGGEHWRHQLTTDYRLNKVQFAPE